MIRDQRQVLCKPRSTSQVPAIHSQRVTLSPLPPVSAAAHCSAFHRALQLFNVRRGSELTYEELDRHEQLIVRELAKTLASEDHPCRGSAANGR